VRPIIGLIFMTIGKIENLFKELLLACLLFTFSGITLALEKPLDGRIVQLLRILATVDNSAARFTEEKTLSVLEKPLIIMGILRYDAPDHLQKQVVSPQPESYDIRGEQLTIITHEGRRKLSLDDYPMLRIFVESLRATLAGNLDTLDRYYRLEFVGTIEKWQLNLLPRDDTVKQHVSQIIIRGQNKRLESIQLYENNGDSSLITLSPLDEK